jgi:hypothetical protein
MLEKPHHLGWRLRGLKSETSVIYRNEERIHAKGWLRKKYIFMLPDISEKRNLR